MTDLRAVLRDRWIRSLPEAPGLVDPLLDRWSEPHRRYHTLDHLAAVLQAVDDLAEPCHDRQLVALAAWYHDAVYEIGASNNEAASAELARGELSPYLGQDRATAVGRLVELTADHRVAPGDHDGALLCDADLAVLAGPEPDYRSYSAAVRQEYASVPEAAFRAGRSRVLANLLASGPLFRTGKGAALEAAAEANLRREIAELSS